MVAFCVPDISSAEAAGRVMVLALSALKYIVAVEVPVAMVAVSKANGVEHAASE